MAFKTIMSLLTCDACKCKETSFLYVHVSWFKEENKFHSTAHIVFLLPGHKTLIVMSFPLALVNKHDIKIDTQYRWKMKNLFFEFFFILS